MKFIDRSQALLKQGTVLRSDDLAIRNQYGLARETGEEMNKDRQREFIEDAVIRMRDLRDQEDCFSKEEFKDRLRARFYEIAGVVVEYTPVSRTQRILLLLWIPVWFIVSGSMVYRQTGDIDILKGVGAMLSVWLLYVFLLLSGKGLERRAKRRIPASTRLTAVDELVRENLITEKQDKALRLLIDEAEKPERFVWSEKAA